jgi:rubrerythrin
LEVAEHREQEAIKEYHQFLKDCDYPDVREMLVELVKERERALLLIKEKREMLLVKFATVDQINESFS